MWAGLKSTLCTLELYSCNEQYAPDATLEIASYARGWIPRPAISVCIIAARPLFKSKIILRGLIRSEQSSIIVNWEVVCSSEIHNVYMH